MKILCFVTLFFFSSQAYRLKFDNFSNGSDLISFHGDATESGGALALTRDNTPFSHGRAILKTPIAFKHNSSSLYPFKTSFTFSVTHHTNPNPGHGLAFVVLPANRNDAGSGLGYLSLVNRTSDGDPNNHLFAVEFDVFQDKSLGDSDGNHVGIDINSVNSVVSAKSGYWVMTRHGWKFEELKLSSGDRYRAWIEYSDAHKVISVTVGHARLKKPNRPLIEAKFDLSKVVLETMYIGFAGSMGRDVERHEIWDWTFQN